MMMVKQNNLTGRKAVSYIRFSTVSQEDGDSIRRQTQSAETFANDNGLMLTNDNFVDLGVSSYRMKNITDGALGRIIEAYETERLNRNTVLLIDDVTRFSRAGADEVIATIKRLTDMDVTLVFIANGLMVDSVSLKNDPGVLHQIVAYGGAAYEFSKRLSAVQDSVYQGRFEKLLEGEGIPLTVVPSWINKTRAETKGKAPFLEIDQGKASTVQRVIDLKLTGMSDLGIAKRMNAEEQPTLGKGQKWHQSAVSYLLKNPALKGTLVYRGKHFEAHLPAMVNAETWDQLQQLQGKSIRRATPRKTSHPFIGLLHCEVCGSRMLRLSSGGRRYSYFSCYSTKTDPCGNGLVRSDKLEEQVISRLWELIGSDFRQQPMTVEKTKPVIELERQIGTLKAMIDTLFDRMLVAKNARAQQLFQDKIDDSSGQLEILEAQLKLETAGDTQETRTASPDQVENALGGLLSALPDTPEDLNVLLVRAIRRLTVYAGRNVVLGDKQAKALVEFLFQDGSTWRTEIRY